MVSVSVVVVAGSPSASGYFLSSLGSLESLKETEPQEGPGRPRKGQTGQRSPKLPIYIGIFRARQKSKFHHGQ